MTVRLALCGDLTVTRNGEELAGPRLGTRKARVLVAALAAAQGGAVPTDRLVEVVWPDRPPRDPAGNLATLASRLRKVVGDGFVEPGTASYALGRSVELDVDVAADLVVSAGARLARGEPTLAVSSASRALDLLGGDDALAEECTGGWADGLRNRTAELRREARHVLADAATETGQSDVARTNARAATDADPYDERAHRDLMGALVRDGRPTAALELYAGLAARLADELGTDPDAETQRLQLAVLRGEPLAGPATVSPSRRTTALVGRDEELAGLDRAWTDASSGRPSLVVLTGVPGIGKTRLLSELSAVAATSGGLVLSAGCRPGERSLFLQPFVEVLRPVLLSLPEPSLRAVLGGHLQAWTQLLPELGEPFGVLPSPEVSHELARRRSFDAIVAVVTGLATRQPVLLAVDDLQYAADVTVELVAHLAARLGSAPLLLVAATRTEGLPALRHLTALAEPLALGPLPPSAVGALATAAGFGTRTDEVEARSHGHPLSVVASLQALATGTVGVPDSFADAVGAQLAALEEGPARVAAAASVLGTRVEPVLLAGLVDRPEVEVVLACERLVRAGLMAPAGDLYDFTNDLVQEAVLATLPRPMAVALHRRTADLTADRPEQMARHAREAGEPDRAARGYLEAARRARRTGALDDALVLSQLAETDAVAADDSALVADVLLERARVNEARADFAAAERDVLAARDIAGPAADPRLRMRTTRRLGGDVAVARRHPLSEVVEHNREGLALAAGLGDAVAEAMFGTRLVVLEATRLRLAAALDMATDGVAAARATESPEAVARSLDGLKSVLAYCGDTDGLRAVLDELVPLLGRLRLPWLLQWALVESALVPAAGGHWAAARRFVDEALEVNRTIGYEAYAGYFRAQRGWLARLAGDLDSALDDGRRSVMETSPADHPWWYASAVGAYATTLLDLGRPDEAGELATAGLTALGDEAGAAYQLRCLAPLAAAGGDTLEEADRLLGEIQAPPGRAWVWGSDAYEAIATAWLAAGEPARAAAAVRPLLASTTVSWRAVHERAAQRTSATSSAARSAPPSGTGR
jgi:DNA-binding SARP family transcriptional activator/tetratricopeptide (TPR) repeat protein